MTEPITTPQAAVTVTTDFEKAYEALARGEGEKLFSHGTGTALVYVLAKTPGKAKELLIEHLGISLNPISLTDANLQFLNLQRLKAESNQPS